MISFVLCTEITDFGAQDQRIGHSKTPNPVRFTSGFVSPRLALVLRYSPYFLQPEAVSLLVLAFAEIEL